MHLWTHLGAALFAQIVLGAYIVPRDMVQHSTRSNVSTGGQEPAQDFQPCGPNETVMTCAENIAKTWQIPTSAQGAPQRMNVSMNMGSVQGYIQPLVYIEASSCSLSNPNFVWQGKPMYCGISMCQYSFTFTTTETKTSTYGFHTSLTLTESIEEDALVAKFTTTVSATVGTDWSESTAETTTNTTTQMFSMSNGQQCTPTTLQYNVQCHTKLRLADDTTQWQWQQKPLEGEAKELMASLRLWSCDDVDTLSSLGDNSEFIQFCKALQCDGQMTSMDVGLPGYNAGPWSMQGCMWQT